MFGLHRLPARPPGLGPGPRWAPRAAFLRRLLGAALLLALPADGAAAQALERLPEVSVSATRSERLSAEVPASVTTVTRDEIHSAGPRVNLSEPLARVPGVVAENRQNYAQDLQISIRGFGARAAFGVRGVRLVADGVPLTMPDGQGQPGLVDLDSAERIEVLRGPFSVLYGNHAGGVIQAFTRAGPTPPEAAASFGAGSFGTWRLGVEGGGAESGRSGYGAASRFFTDGYREHSRARRNLLNAKLTGAAGPDTVGTLVVNALDQPDSLDPQGLTRAQLEADPRQAAPSALAFNTRKSVDNRQAGVSVEHALGGGDRLIATAWGGTRDVVQFLSVPVAAQAAPTSAGGVIDFDRRFGGAGLRYVHQADTAGRPLTLTAGVDLERSRDDRRGYENFVGTTLGAAGRLRRSEIDTVTQTGGYLQAEWTPAARWNVTAGARYTEVEFEVDDRYVAPGNPDDSGRVRYGEWTGAAGASYAPAPALFVYAALGRGFETPTLNELFYRPDGGSGLNFSLVPAISDHLETGLKLRGARTVTTLALYGIRTEDEIVVAQSLGGRTSFRNAGRTRRLGVELSGEALLAHGFRAFGAFTRLDATFADAFATCTGTPCAPAVVPSGNRIPGVPKSAFFGELAWRHAAGGFNTALEARWKGRVYVDDLNTDAAGSFFTLAWRAGFKYLLGDLAVEPFVRVDNLFDRRYAASVIVGEANGRYFEPAPGRSFFAGVTVRQTF
ncbi:MAG: TonB-dependent receptor family protein [Pseudomonadota bacterium]